MRLSWLALALAVSAVVVAHVEAQAKRIACSCPTEITLPAVRTSDLPSNTQLWTLPATADTPVRSMNMSPSPFTGAPDYTAPEAPHDVFVSIISSSQFAAPAPIDAISMFGQYAPDTEIIHVEIRDRDGTHQLWTTPEHRYLCFPGLALEPGRLDITIYALDLAGNASSPFHTTTETSFIAPADRDETCIEHRHHHGHGFEILGLLFLWLVLLLFWIVYLIGRRALARRELPEEVPVLAAEEIVRRLQRWQLVWTAMLTFAVFGLYAAHHDAELLSVMIAPFAIAAFCRLLLVHYASRLLHRPEAGAVRHGRWLCVTTLHGSQLVRASDADFVAGKRASLPRSVAR